MLITLYTPIGIIYQKFEITEHDIIYRDMMNDMIYDVQILIFILELYLV